MTDQQPNEVEDTRKRLAENPYGMTRAEDKPSTERLAQGLLPDVLDPMAPGVTTQDRAAEMTDNVVISDAEANRPIK